MNIENINEKIESGLHDAQRKDRIKKHILRNEALLDAMRMELKALERSLKKEERDVLILENQNLQSLFLTVLGNHEKQLEIERQEYLMALLKYNEIVDAIHVKEYELNVLENLLQIIELELKGLDLLLKKKEKYLREKDKQVAIRITLKDQEIATIIKKLQAIEDALKEGDSALKILSEIKADLSQVRDWGTWQYYGAGRNSAYAKKSFIDKARKKAIGASIIISNFENDLKEVFEDLDTTAPFRLDHFEQFLNIFYEHLITDWIIQKNIKNAAQNIQMTMDKMSRLMATVRNRQKKLQKALDDQKMARRDIIIKN